MNLIYPVQIRMTKKKTSTYTFKQQPDVEAYFDFAERLIYRLTMLILLVIGAWKLLTS